MAQQDQNTDPQSRNNERLRAVHGALSASGAVQGLPDFETFSSQMADTAVQRKFYNNLKGRKIISGLPSDFKEFQKDMFGQPTPPTGTTDPKKAEEGDISDRFVFRRARRQRDLEEKINRLSEEAGKLSLKAKAGGKQRPLPGRSGGGQFTGFTIDPDPELEGQASELRAERDELQGIKDQLRQQELDEMDTGQSAGSSAFSSFAQGTLRNLSEKVLKSAGVLSNRMRSRHIAGLPATPTYIEVMEERGEEINTADNPFYKAGEQVGGMIEEMFPTNPKFQEDFWISVFPQALGSTAAFAAGGAAGRVIGLPATLGASALGSTVVASDEFERAIEQGEDEDTAFQTWLFNLPAGAIEGLPIGQAFARLNKATGGGVIRVLKDGIQGGVEEAIQEVAQQTMSNATAQTIYDQTRQIGEGLTTGGQAGFVTGFVLNTLMSALGARRRGAEGKMAEEIDKAMNYLAEKQSQVLKDVPNAQELMRQVERQEPGQQIDQPAGFKFDPNAPVEEQIQQLRQAQDDLRGRLDDPGPVDPEDIELALDAVSELLARKRAELEVGPTESQDSPREATQEEASSPEPAPSPAETVFGEGETQTRYSATQNEDGSFTVNEVGVIPSTEGTPQNRERSSNRVQADSEAEAIEVLRQERIQELESNIERERNRLPRVREERPELAPAIEAGIELQEQQLADLRSDAIPQESQEAPTPENIQGSLPEGDTIKVAARGNDGTLYMGEQGDAHINLLDRYNIEIDDVAMGFADADGNFMESIGAKEPGINNAQRRSQPEPSPRPEQEPEIGKPVTRVRGDLPQSGVRAAYRYGDGTTFIGNSHADILNEYEDQIDVGLAETGFINPEGRFLTREEAAQQAGDVAPEAAERGTLFAEDLPRVQTVELPVMDGAYNVRRDQDGFTVINQKTGQPVGRTSNNYNQAVAEHIVNDPVNNAEFVDDTQIENEEQYLESVATSSNNPLEIAQAHQIAREIEGIEQEAMDIDVLEQFYDTPGTGGQIRVEDVNEYADPVLVRDNPRLRFKLDATGQATPLDVQAAILSREAGREITPGEIIDFFVEKITPLEGQQETLSGRLENRFREITGQTLTTGLSNEIANQQLQEFTDDQGNILPEVQELVDKYIDEDGVVDYQRLWDEGLSQDQDKGFFTSFPGNLSEDQYQQLKQEVQDAIAPSQEEASGSQQAVEQSPQGPATEQSQPPSEEIRLEPYQMSQDEFIRIRPPVQGFLYHGSPEGDISEFDPYTHTRLWREGQGVYATESRDMARQYALGRTARGERRSSASDQGKINYVENQAQKVLDLEAPIDQGLWDRAAEELEVNREVLEGTNGDAFHDIRENLIEEWGSTDAYYMFEEWLRKEGFEATTHIEGKNNTPHKVFIFKGDSGIDANGTEFNTLAIRVVPAQEVHKQQVEEALNRGERIPQRVLRDYPDLRHQASEDQIIPDPRAYGQNNRIISPQRAEEIRNDLRNRLGGQFNAGIDPTVARRMMELAIFHLEAGSRKFADFASEMIRDVGDKVKPYLRTLYKQAKARSTDIPKADFSTDQEIIEWQRQNMSENDLINSIDRGFRRIVELQEAQGYKTVGRPELANPVKDPEARQFIDFVDQLNEEQGIPSPRGDEQVLEEANRRLEEDYDGERARIFDLAQDYNEGLWNDVDVMMAKMILEREAADALSSNDKALLYDLFLISGIYRKVGTEQGRALRMRADDVKTPEERKAERVSGIFQDLSAATEIATEIHRLAEQVRQNEISRKEFGEQLKSTISDHESQREQQAGPVKRTVQKAVGKRITEGQIDQIFNAIHSGKETTQEAVNDHAGKMNLPKMSIPQLLELEALVENVENANPGRAKNQALLELLKFVERTNIAGGDITRAMRADIDDILNRQQDLFDASQDIIRSVRHRVIGNITQALMMPPKDLRDKLDSTHDPEEIKRIWEVHYDRLQGIKAALKNDHGIDIENLTEKDISDPVTMHSVLRYFQAANADFDSKAYEFWNNAILSALGTHGANFSGNAANLFYQSVPIRLAETVINTVAGDPNSAQWGELRHFYKGFFTYLPEAIRYAGLAWQTESRLFAEEIGTERGIGKFQDKVEKGVAIKGKTGRFIRSMGWRALTFMDEFFKVLGFRAQLAAVAYREGKRQGLTGQKLEEFIERQQLNPEGQVSEAAWGWSLETVFQEEAGPVTELFVRAREMGNPVLKYIIPFVKTPGNLLKQGIRKGPLGMMNLMFRSSRAATYKIGLSKNKNWEYSRQEFTKHASEQLAFWTLAGLGMLIYNEMDDDDPRPLVTGSGPSYRNQSAYRFAQQNLPPQSLRLPGSDRWISYRRLEPFSTMLTSTVDMLDAMQAAENGQEMVEVYGDFFEKNLRNVRDKSYLKGIGDMTRMLDYPASSLNWTGDFTSSWMPNIIKYAIHAGDDYVREYTKGTSGESVEAIGKNMMDRMAQKAFPFEGNQPPPRVNWLGKPVRKDPWGGPGTAYLYRAVSPFISYNHPPSDYDELILNWNNQNPGDQYYPTVPQDFFTVDGEQIRMSQEQYFQYVVRRGFHTERLLDENYHRLDIQLPTQESIDVIESAQRQAGQIAKEELINEGIVVPLGIE